MASVARSALLRQMAVPASGASLAVRFSNTALARPAVQRGIITTGARVTAFHTTSRRDLLPPGPQVIHGGVNDPAPVPPPSPSHGSYHWTFERVIAAGLIPLTIAPFAGGSVSPTLDAVLCATVLVHSHLGFQSIIIDYIPKREYPGLHKLFWWGLRAATFVAGVGLYEFETTDVGLTEAVKRIWKA